MTRTVHTSPLRTLSLAAGDIKLAHSVFALPFAILAAAMALPPEMSAWRVGVLLGLVVVCMVLARTWAMLFNRLVDREYDRLNPRTSGRLLARGEATAQQVLALALAVAAAFVLATGVFWVVLDNAWPLVLSVPVLAWIAFYSLTKRFTLLCHLFLGSALAVSPLAAAVAVEPSSVSSMAALWWLAGMVLFWVAGFDVIYALQDVDFDRREGLHSVPARLGARGAAWASRAMHVLAFACLAMAGLSEARFGVLFALGVAAVGALLVAEHAVLARRGEAGLDMAFFTLNGVVSVVLGVVGLVDLLV